MAKKKKQKNYVVTLYFHTNLTVPVCAENEQEAKDIARSKACEWSNLSALLEGMQEDDSPDVDEV